METKREEWMMGGERRRKGIGRGNGNLGREGESHAFEFCQLDSCVYTVERSCMVL